MNVIGVPELLVILMICAIWLIPIAAGIWAVVTLHRIRTDQKAMQVKLDAIEQAVQRR